MFRMTWALRGLAIGIALAALVAACGAAATPTLAPPTVVATTPSVAPPTAAPTVEAAPTPPADAAPAALQGKWTTPMGLGDDVDLVLSDNGYRFTRGGNNPYGHISVNGATIEFSASPQCIEGSGTYTWAITGEQLTFTQVGAKDPCPRGSLLLGQVYARKTG
ncbi:MAG: hypothetical protein ABI620_03575 [Chloroflexota bacterium]